jgi:putative ABC transport system ATP-binding protein
MVETIDLSFKYKHGQAFSFPNLTLNPKAHLLILGKSGIGKTTFLHLLAGLLTPEKGTIAIGGVTINTLSHKKLDQFRGQNIGLVFQKKYAIPSLSVLKNLEARLYFSKKPIVTSKIEALLYELDLMGHRHKKLSELSEGQLQRLSIAMAVVHQPQVILADEPTSSLDDDNCNSVIKLLKTQAQQNRANLIVITHDSRLISSFSNTITL